MKIAVLGTGRVGSVLGSQFAAHGHEVMFGSRDPHSDRVHQLVKSIGGDTRASTIDVAGGWGEVVVLATPWSAAEEVLQAAGDLDGKVLVDATTPIGPNGMLLTGFDTSGGEQVAAWAPGAQVVKAFNATGAGNMVHPEYGPLPTSLFLCGDSVEAKRVVSQLGAEMGFDPVDCGPIIVSRYLEPLAMLWAQLAFQQGFGPDIAFVLARRPQEANL
jgi:predicted dinucleotide-binding enzyme